MAVYKIDGAWWIDFRWEGVRYRRKSLQDTRDGAVLFEMEMRQHVIDDGFCPSRRRPHGARLGLEDLLFVHFAKRWFDTYVCPQLSLSTQRAYGLSLRRHLLPRFGHLPIHAITTYEIDAFKALQTERGTHPKYLNNQLSILRRCLGSAADWGLLRKLPSFQWMKVPPAPFDFLSPAESRCLLETTSESSWRLMIRVALRTGMRLGELLALSWEDVDLERRMIHVRRSMACGIVKPPKNNRFRYIPISLDLEQAFLERGLSTQGRLFPFRAQQAEDALARARTAASLRRFGWHALRHTFASQLASTGVPIHAIQAFMGHSTLQMTMRYAHLAPMAFKEAVDLLHARERDVVLIQRS